MSFNLPTDSEGFRSLLRSAQINIEDIVGEIESSQERDQLYPLFLQALSQREVMHQNASLSEKVITWLPSDVKKNPEYKTFVSTLIDSGVLKSDSSALSTAFKEACHSQDIDLAFKVLENLDLSSQDTILHDACLSKDPQLLQAVLLRLPALKRASLIHKRNSEGNAPLDLACLQGNIAAANLLLERGAQLDLTHQNGLTPLHQSISQENFAMAEFLLSKGADATIPDRSGNTPFHTAALKGSVATLKLLTPYFKNLNIKNELGFSPLDLAQINKQDEASNFLIKIGAHNRDIYRKHKNYMTKISLDPPKPQEGVNNPRALSNASNFRAFIDKHDPSVQSAIQAMIQATDYVSFSTFSKNLDLCIEALNHSIAPGEKYLVVVEPQKSNKWLAELALPKLATLPENVVTLNDIDKVLKKDPSIKTIVFFDDASYSGEQLCRFVRTKAIDQLVENARDGFSIHVAVPYMTEWAERKLTALAQDRAVTQNSGKITLAPHQRMRSAASQVDSRHHETLLHTYFPYSRGKDLLYLTQGTTSYSEQSIFFRDDILSLVEEFGADFTDKAIQLKTLVDDIYRKNGGFPGMSNEEIHLTLTEDPRVLSFAVDLKAEVESFHEAHKGDIDHRILHYQTALSSSSGRNNPLQPKLRLLRELRQALEDAEELKKSSQFELGLNSRTFTVFDHKVADALSTCPGYESGEVFFKGSYVVDQTGSLRVDGLFPGNPPYKTVYN